MRCCQDLLNIGCFVSCGRIQTPLIANQDGEYIIEYLFRGYSVTQSYPFVVGDEIAFDNLFNEVGIAKIRIIRPDGEFYTLEDEFGDVYSCFSFDMKIQAYKEKNVVVEEDDCGVCTNLENLYNCEDES